MRYSMFLSEDNAGILGSWLHSDSFPDVHAIREAYPALRVLRVWEYPGNHHRKVLWWDYTGPAFPTPPEGGYWGWVGQEYIPVSTREIWGDDR